MRSSWYRMSVIAIAVVLLGGAVLRAQIKPPPPPPPPPPSPEEVKRKADEEARKAAEEAKRQADEAKRNAEEAARKAEEERKKAEADARAKAEEAKRTANQPGNTAKPGPVGPRGVRLPPPPLTPPLPPPPPANVQVVGLKKEEQALLVISTGLQKYGKKDAPTQLLYKFLQDNGAATAQAQLGPKYGQTVVLATPEEGTVVRFCAALRDLAERHRAVDVIIHCHGESGVLLFEDHAFNVGDLTKAMTTDGNLAVAGDKQIKVATIPEASRKNLRVVLETACYGASHAQAWLDLGFCVAAGSQAVHCDSAASFPTFMNYWANSYTFKEAVEAQNRCDPTDSYDKWASQELGFKDCQSNREIKGFGGIRFGMPPFRRN